MNIQVLRPVNARWASRLSIGTGAVAVAVVVGFIVTNDDAWPMAPLIPMGLAFILLGILSGMARVEVAADSIKVVDLRRPRGRLIPKESIVGTRIDPPGGLRQIYLRQTSGEEVALPPLDDTDSAVVQATNSTP